MAIQLKVLWIDKSGETGAGEIRFIGGACKELQWRHTYDQAVESIEQRQFDYYVEKNSAALRLEIKKTSDGKKLLTVERADEHILHELPSFPNTSNFPAARQRN